MGGVAARLVHRMRMTEEPFGSSHAPEAGSFASCIELKQRLNDVFPGPYRREFWKKPVSDRQLVAAVLAAATQAEIINDRNAFRWSLPSDPGATFTKYYCEGQERLKPLLAALTPKALLFHQYAVMQELQRREMGGPWWAELNTHGQVNTDWLSERLFVDLAHLDRFLKDPRSL